MILQGMHAVARMQPPLGVADRALRGIVGGEHRTTGYPGFLRPRSLVVIEHAVTCLCLTGASIDRSSPLRSRLGQLQTRADVETALDDVACLMEALERALQGPGYESIEEPRHRLSRIAA